MSTTNEIRTAGTKSWHEESKNLEAVDVHRDQLDDLMENIFLMGFSKGVSYVMGDVADGLARDAGIEVDDD